MKLKYFIGFSIIYLAILATEIYAEHHFVVTKDFDLLAILQPSLVPGLILYLLFHFRSRFSVMAKWVLAGLLLDWASDIVLTYFHDEFNIPCVLGYLAANTCYSIGFIKSTKESGYKVSLINRFIFSLAPIFYILMYYLFIFNYISSHEAKSIFLIPVSIYACSMLLMSTSALWRMGTTSSVSYWCIVAGALFYMLSDSITGYHYFVEPVYMRYVANMFAYGISIYLFTIGTILHQSPVKKI